MGANEQNLSKLLENLASCEKSCSDYSCVRSYGCTGSAGHAVSEYWREKEQRQKDLKERDRIRYLLSLEGEVDESK